jgi:hypothetical protein
MLKIYILSLLCRFTLVIYNKAKNKVKECKDRLSSPVQFTGTLTIFLIFNF